MTSIYHLLIARSDGIHDSIFNCLSVLGMSQLVTQLTRIAKTGHANILDLILTNDPLSINIINYLPPFGTSDHLMIHFIMYYNSVSNIPDDLHETHLPKYDWPNGDYDKINECLFNFDWNLLFGYNFDINFFMGQFQINYLASH